MINLQMNQLRHNGSLRYSRKGIQIYAQALRDYLRPQGLGLPGAVPVPSAIAE
jgi:hypothetical protein